MRVTSWALRLYGVERRRPSGLFQGEALWMFSQRFPEALLCPSPTMRVKEREGL